MAGVRVKGVTGLIHLNIRTTPNVGVEFSQRVSGNEELEMVLIRSGE